MISTSYLLINFALVKNIICYILSIILSLFYLNSWDVIELKSLCKESIIIIIAILPQISLFNIIAALKQL